MKKLIIATTLSSSLILSPLAGAIELYMGLSMTTLGAMTSLCSVFTFGDLDRCLGYEKQEVDRRVEDAFVARATGEMTVELQEFVQSLKSEMPGLANVSDQEIIANLADFY